MKLYKILVVLLFGSLALAQSEEKDSLKVNLPDLSGSTTNRTKLPWRPPPAGELSEIYDYTLRSNVSNGPGSGDQTPASSLGRTLHSQTQSHVLGLRYSINQKWGIRLVGEALDNHYTIQKKDGQEEDVFVQGFGDMKAQGIYSIYRDPYHRFEASGGTTIPTGATDLVGPNGKPLSSRNQLGSGTFDFVPELSYQFTKRGWELGDKIGAVLHNGKNSNGYTNGDEFSNTMTARYLLLSFLSPSLTANIKNRQRKITDNPEVFAVKSTKVRTQDDSGTPVLPGPGAPDSFGAPGWSFSGTAALRSQLPLGASSPIRAAVEVGIPIFNVGRSDTGMKTEWFAGSYITSTF